MTHQNIFVKSAIISAIAITLAGSLVAPVYAQGGRDPVELKSAQEFAQPSKAAKKFFFGKRKATKNAAHNKGFRKSGAILSTETGVKRYK